MTPPLVSLFRIYRILVVTSPGLDDTGDLDFLRAKADERARVGNAHMIAEGWGYRVPIGHVSLRRIIIPDISFLKNLPFFDTLAAHPI